MTARTETAAAASGVGVRTAERSALAHDLATIRVLAVRDVVRFFRERTRIVGALAQPLLFWLVIGSGMSGTFRLPGAEGVGYMEYFFPGVVMMVILFTSIFATMSVIEDRSAGFLQAVLVGPGSRAAVVVGKSLGASTVALIQAGLFVALAPLAGRPYGEIDWPMLAAGLVVTSLALTTLGFAVAWLVGTTQGYHVVMSLVLLPLWILSGAMFPVPKVEWVERLLACNPMSYAVSVVRAALYGGDAPTATTFTSGSAWIDLAILAGFAGGFLALAVTACVRKR